MELYTIARRSLNKPTFFWWGTISPRPEKKKKGQERVLQFTKRCRKNQREARRSSIIAEKEKICEGREEKKGGGRWLREAQTKKRR